MTGGQSAPTTLPGQKTVTSPSGRQVAKEGPPLHMAELLAQLSGVKFCQRVSLHSPPEIIKAKAAIKQAFLNQVNNAGFSLVEILSSCPTYWGMNPRQALDWIRDVMAKEFPLGRIK